MEQLVVSPKIKQRKVETWLGQLQPLLLPGEEPRGLFPASSLTVLVEAVVVTNARLLAVGPGSGRGWEVKRQLSFDDITAVRIEAARFSGVPILVAATTAEGDVAFGQVKKEDSEVIIRLVEALRAAGPARAVVEAQQELRDQEQAADAAWSSVPTGGRSATHKERAAIKNQARPGEVAKFIIGGDTGGGALGAFEDRCVIVKVGGLTTLMAGSVGGGRHTTFFYKQVTGVEYNAGWINGVLEILTPSYDGSANKDFWRGATSSRNANSNDPFTLSNTLPLAKATYASARPFIEELKRMVAEAHTITVTVTAPVATPPEGGLAAEITKLAELHKQGVLDDEEFKQAKQRLIAKGQV